MKEQIERLHQLAEQIYQDTKDKESLSRSALRYYEDVIEEMQKQVDSMTNEILRAAQD